jgi:uncharacterized membrane protein
MLRNALLFSTAVLLALTAGRAFWVWLGESPFGMPAATYVDFFQQLDNRIAIPIGVIGVLGPGLAGLSAVVCRANRRTFLLLIAASGFGVATVLVTVLVNVPINEQIATWNPRALPPGYENVLTVWWNWHIVRLFTSLAAMCSAFSALLARDTESAVPTA